MRTLEKKRAGLAYIAAGGTVLGNENRVPAQRTNLSTAIDEWLEIIEEKFSGDSYGVKKLVLDEFLHSYGKKTKPKYVEDIQRVDALRFINTYLNEQGNSDRTRWNKFLHLRQFFSEYKHNVFMKGDAPKYGRRDPEAYTDEQIAAYFSKCDTVQFVLFSVFYSCGLRLGEVQTLRWSDVNLKERFIHIDERPEYGWKPKKWHVRDIPISQELTTNLLKLKENSQCPLVFHTRSGKPIYQMLEMCKRIAVRAGIPREEAWLHKWRATFCVELLREGVDLPSIQAMMGHKGKGQTARDCKLATGSPVLAVVGTENDTPPDCLRGGQALERMVLRARAEGVWASFMNQPIEVPELRPKLLDVMGRKGFPPLLVRMGCGPDVKGTPLRPVNGVLLSQDTTSSRHPLRSVQIIQSPLQFAGT
jgi:integrase